MTQEYREWAETFTTPDGVQYTMTVYPHGVQFRAIWPDGVALDDMSLPRHIAQRFANALQLDSDVREVAVEAEGQLELPLGPPWQQHTDQDAN